MKTKTSNILAVAASAVLLVMATAGASVYMMENDTKDEKTEVVHVSSNNSQPTPKCDDDNIVGKVIGGAAGGVLGSQVGGGSGKTAATIGGSVGGTVLGEKYINTKNVTCRN